MIGSRPACVYVCSQSGCSLHKISFLRTLESESGFGSTDSSFIPFPLTQLRPVQHIHFSLPLYTTKKSIYLRFKILVRKRFDPGASIVEFSSLVTSSLLSASLRQCNAWRHNAWRHKAWRHIAWRHNAWCHERWPLVPNMHLMIVDKRQNQRIASLRCHDNDLDRFSSL